MANKRAVLPGLGIKIVPFLLRLFPRVVHPGGGRPFSAAQALKRGCGSRPLWPAICLQIFVSVHELTRN